jgi:hypothetical protein
VCGNTKGKAGKHIPEIDCVREIWREKQAKKPACIISAGLPGPGLAHSAQLKKANQTLLIPFN